MKELPANIRPIQAHVKRSGWCATARTWSVSAFNLDLSPRGPAHPAGRGLDHGPLENGWRRRLSPQGVVPPKASVGHHDVVLVVGGPVASGYTPALQIQPHQVWLAKPYSGE